MRILFVTRYHLPSVGGAQFTTHYLVNELNRRGHSASVLAPHDPERLGLPDLDRSLGYPTFRTETPERVLRGMLGRGEADVVVVNGNHAAMAEPVRGFLRAAAHVPTVLYLHDVGALPLVTESELHVDELAAVSGFLERAVKAQGAAVTCVPPMIPASGYSVHTTRRVALFINPVPAKGLSIALALAEARPDIPFVFSCCWQIRPRTLGALRTEARRLGNVEIRPPVHEPEVLYGDARVLLAPSRYPESWGRVAAEAQMSGIPVLATDIGGLPEAVGDGGILLGEDATAEAWVEALSRLWDDEATYTRYVVRAEQQARRSDTMPEVVGDRFEQLLWRAQGRRGEARRFGSPRRRRAASSR